MKQHPEGRILIRLTRRADGRASATLSSSRPFAASRWFEGKSIAETLRLLPMIYRVCGTAQAAAAVAAIESAQGLVANADQRNAREALVLAETLREHLLRVLTGWIDPTEHPGLLPRISRVMQLPSSLGNALYPHHDAFVAGGGRLELETESVTHWIAEARALLTAVVLGIPPDQWRLLEDMAGIEDWSGSAQGAASWLVRDIAQQRWQSVGATRMPPLPPLDNEVLAARMDAEENFIAQPDWEGAVCETGAFARVGEHPLVKDARRAYGDGLLARALARLVEVASIPDQIENLLSGDPERSVPSGMPASHGVSQVEAARGRLVHRVRLEGDTVAFYRILAPTEWNFHPRGVVAQALAGLPPTADPRRLGGLLVEAVDPCVGYDLEVDGDA